MKKARAKLVSVFTRGEGAITHGHNNAMEVALYN